jgi:hypothetical protein
MLLRHVEATAEASLQVEHAVQAGRRIVFPRASVDLRIVNLPSLPP